MSQLEPQLRALLRARMKHYLIAHKMTTVVVTYDQTEAIALADRIAVMEQGVLQQVDLHGTFDDGQTMDATGVDVCADKTLNLLGRRSRAGRPSTAGRSCDGAAFDDRRSGRPDRAGVRVRQGGGDL